MATAEVATEVMLREMPVSVRTRLPTSTAWRKSMLSAVPAVPSDRARSQACLT